MKKTFLDIVRVTGVTFVGVSIVYLMSDDAGDKMVNRLINSWEFWAGMLVIGGIYITLMERGRK